MRVTDVEIQRNIARNGHDVFILVDVGGRRGVIDGDGATVFYESGEQIQPTVQLPEGGLDALVSAALRVAPRAEAVEATLRDALDDARAVRDRLLTMAEMEADVSGGRSR